MFDPALCPDYLNHYRLSDSCTTDGWIVRETDSIFAYPEPLREIYIYFTAFYFITTTATTVGYGDYGGVTWSEMLYMIIIEFTGICVLSIITGKVRGILFQTTIDNVMKKKS